jgi:soluble lytic murein transglycosylase-like protein
MSSKTIKTLLFIFVLTFLNIGAKFPAMSESTAASDNNNISLEKEMSEAEKYMKMYEEIYQMNLVMQIEFESEVIIPKYFDFKYVEYTYNTAKQLNVPSRTAFRLMFKESSFIDTIKSPVGAEGLMQLMPQTRAIYKEFLRTDTLNLDKNQEDIYIGLYIMREGYDFWNSRGNSENYSWKLSLASYNSGKGTVIKYKGIPPIKETTDFVTFILKVHSNPQFYSNILRKSAQKDIT